MKRKSLLLLIGMTISGCWHPPYEELADDPATDDSCALESAYDSVTASAESAFSANEELLLVTCNVYGSDPAWWAVDLEVHGSEIGSVGSIDFDFLGPEPYGVEASDATTCKTCSVNVWINDGYDWYPDSGRGSLAWTSDEATLELEEVVFDDFYSSCETSIVLFYCEAPRI